MGKLETGSSKTQRRLRETVPESDERGNCKEVPESAVRHTRGNANQRLEKGMGDIYLIDQGAKTEK